MNDEINLLHETSNVSGKNPIFFSFYFRIQFREQYTDTILYLNTIMNGLSIHMLAGSCSN